MAVHDYNGKGRWSRQAIQSRYDELARRFRVRGRSDLQPVEHVTATGHWIYPVMERVIAGIERGDPACAEIGVEFIEEDQLFPFGRILKANTARALRRTELTAAQRERIRKRVVEMLVAGHTPREYREYAKLARKIGLGRWWPWVKSRVNLTNRYVRRYYDYFSQYAAGDEESSA